MDIKANVKLVAKARGYKFEDLAAGLGITRMALFSRMRDPKLSTLEELARFLGVGVEEFFSPGLSSSVDCVCPHCGSALRVVLM